jgi:tetratricopeptide (TPR) repeat protein
MTGVLRAAMQSDPKDARAPYYLGLLLYDRQPEEAVRMWQKTVELEPGFALAWRNLAVAYSRQADGVPRAIEALEKAVSLHGNDALYLFELDRLYEFARAPVDKRLALFDNHRATAERRDDAMSRYVALLVLSRRYDEAIAILEKRHFHLWEGGARFHVQDAWTDAHLLRGHQKMAANDYEGAWKDYLAAIEFPENLEVARGVRGPRVAQAFYYAGVAAEAAGRKADAEKAWRQAAGALHGGEREPRPSVDTAPAMLYYQARALEKLGQSGRAQQLYQELLVAAGQAMEGVRANEFFAKFGEGRPPWMRQASAHLAAGLAQLGLGRREQARTELKQALELNPYLLEARLQLEQLQ